MERIIVGVSVDTSEQTFTESESFRKTIEVAKTVMTFGTTLVVVVLWATNGVNGSSAEAKAAMTKALEIEGRQNRMLESYKTLDTKIDALNSRLAEVNADGKATRAMVEILLQRLDRK